MEEDTNRTCDNETCKNTLKNLQMLTLRAKGSAQDREIIGQLKQENELLGYKLAECENMITELKSIQEEVVNRAETATAELLRMESERDLYKNRVQEMLEKTRDAEKHLLKANEFADKYEQMGLAADKLLEQLTELQKKYEKTVSLLNQVTKKSTQHKNNADTFKRNFDELNTKQTKLNKYLKNSISLIDFLASSLNISNLPNDISDLIKTFRKDDVRLYFNSDPWKSDNNEGSSVSTFVDSPSQETNTTRDKITDDFGLTLSDEDDEEPGCSEKSMLNNTNSPSRKIIKSIATASDSSNSQNSTRPNLDLKWNELKQKKQKVINRVERAPRKIKNPESDRTELLNQGIFCSRTFQTVSSSHSNRNKNDFDKINKAADFRKKELLERGEGSTSQPNSEPGIGQKQGASTIIGKKGKTVREIQSDMMKKVSAKEMAAKLKAEEIQKNEKRKNRSEKEASMPELTETDEQTISTKSPVVPKIVTPVTTNETLVNLSDIPVINIPSKGISEERKRSCSSSSSMSSTVELRRSSRLSSVSTTNTPSGSPKKVIKGIQSKRSESQSRTSMKISDEEKSSSEKLRKCSESSTSTTISTREQRLIERKSRSKFENEKKGKIENVQSNIEIVQSTKEKKNEKEKDKVANETESEKDVIISSITENQILPSLTVQENSQIAVANVAVQEEVLDLNINENSQINKKKESTSTLKKADENSKKENTESKAPEQRKPNTISIANSKAKRSKASVVPENGPPSRITTIGKMSAPKKKVETKKQENEEKHLKRPRVENILTIEKETTKKSRIGNDEEAERILNLDEISPPIIENEPSCSSVACEILTEDFSLINSIEKKRENLKTTEIKDKECWSDEDAEDVLMIDVDQSNDKMKDCLEEESFAVHDSPTKPLETSPQPNTENKKKSVVDQQADLGLDISDSDEEENEEKRKKESKKLSTKEIVVKQKSAEIKQNKTNLVTKKREGTDKKTILIEPIIKKRRGVKQEASNLEKKKSKADKLSGAKAQLRQALDLKLPVHELKRPMEERGYILEGSIPLSAEEAVDVMIEYLQQTSHSDMWMVLLKYKLEGNFSQLVNHEEQNFLNVSVSLNDNDQELLRIFIRRILFELSARSNLNSTQCGCYSRLFCHAVRFVEAESEEKQKWFRNLIELLFLKHETQTIKCIAYCLNSEVSEHCKWIVEEIEANSDFSLIFKKFLHMDPDQCGVVNWLLNCKFQKSFIVQPEKEEIVSKTKNVFEEFLKTYDIKIENGKIIKDNNEKSKELQKLSISLGKTGDSELLQFIFDILKKNMNRMENVFLDKNDEQIASSIFNPVSAIDKKISVEESIRILKTTEWLKNMLLVFIDNSHNTHWKLILSALAQISIKIVELKEELEKWNSEKIDKDGLIIVRDAISILAELISEFTCFPLQNGALVDN